MLTVAIPWAKHRSNVGVLIRTCEAVNAQAVVPYTTESFTGNTPKHVPFMVPSNQIDRWIKQQAYYSTLVCVETGGSNIFEVDRSTIDEDITLLLGHEATGIPQRVLDLADLQVSIPQLGRNPSLNVAVAGSIAAYWFAGLIQ